jgi:hypothetical protein
MPGGQVTARQQALLTKTAARNLCLKRWGKVGDGTYDLLMQEAKARQTSLGALLARLATAARMARLEGKHYRKVIR